jgi:hypothetical protein
MLATPDPGSSTRRRWWTGVGIDRRAAERSRCGRVGDDQLDALARRHRHDDPLGHLDPGRHRAVHDDAVALPSPGWRGTAGGREHQGGARLHLEPEGVGHHVVDDGSARSGGPERRERGRDGLCRGRPEDIGPAQLEQRRGGLRRAPRLAQRTLEAGGQHGQVVGVEDRHASAPRSSSRRAMMLRWISPVPP